MLNRLRRKAGAKDSGSDDNPVNRLVERDGLARSIDSAATMLRHILEMEAAGQITRGEALVLYHMVLSDALYNVMQAMMPVPEEGFIRDLSLPAAAKKQATRQ